MSDMGAMIRPLGKPYKWDQEDLRKRSRSAAIRRIVLLTANGAIEKVLWEGAAHGFHERFREFQVANRGRILAGEWLGVRRWVRWIETTDLPTEE